MRNRVALLPFAVSIALVAGYGLAAAAPGEVVKSGVEFVATGKVVAKTSDSLVVRTDDHGHKIAFAVDRSTVLPEDLAIGRHVRVVYHPMGSTGQTADKVTITNSQRAGR
jgi:hypothetical protein